jgi:CHAD domain-containing protein
MSNELSLKFSIDPTDHARLLRHPLLKGAVARPSEQIFNIHYDTRTLQLHHRAVELTLKRHGGSWLQTVKHARTVATSELATDVWSVQYFNHFDFSGIDDDKLRNWLSQSKVANRISPIFESDLRHSGWRVVLTSGAIVDAKVYRGSLVSSGRRQIVNDLELVLIDGGRADLYEVATQLASRVVLRRQLQTISERGGNLFRNTPASPTKAESLDLTASAMPLHAFQQIALSCLRQIHANQSGAITSKDPEYIHQMRVAVRRFKAALLVFKPMIPPTATEQMAVPLRDLMQVLGRARDLDVVIGEIVSPVIAQFPDDPSLVALSVSLDERRFRALGEISDRLGKIGYGQSQLQVEALLHSASFDTSQSRTGGAIHSVSHENAPTDLKGFAKRRLRNLFNKMKDSVRQVQIENPTSLHELRICIKRLRYALEFFRQMMPKKASSNTLQLLVNAQEKLGKLNDIAVAGEVLLLCVAADRSLHQTVSLVASAHAQRYAQLLADVAIDIKLLDAVPLPRLS